LPLAPPWLPRSGHDGCAEPANLCLVHVPNCPRPSGPETPPFGVFRRSRNRVRFSTATRRWPGESSRRTSRRCPARRTTRPFESWHLADRRAAVGPRLRFLAPGPALTRPGHSVGAIRGRRWCCEVPQHEHSRNSAGCLVVASLARERARPPARDNASRLPPQPSGARDIPITRTPRGALLEIACMHAGGGLLI
jgi:hypothetical protein